MAFTIGMAVMDVESYDQSPNAYSNSYDNNSFPVPMRPARPERKSLPGIFLYYFKHK